eukprot:8965591-Pyramimonas_sp.AAC.1
MGGTLRAGAGAATVFQRSNGRRQWGGTECGERTRRWATSSSCFQILDERGRLPEVGVGEARGEHVERGPFRVFSS